MEIVRQACCCAVLGCVCVVVECGAQPQTTQPNRGMRLDFSFGSQKVTENGKGQPVFIKKVDHS